MSRDPTSAARLVAGAHRADAGNQPTRAEDLYREALTLDPLSVGALAGLASILSRRRRQDEALSTLRRLLLIAPGDPAAMRSLSTARMSVDDRSGYVRALSRLLVLTPDDSTAWMQVATLATEARSRPLLARALDGMARHCANRPAGALAAALFRHRNGDGGGARRAFAGFMQDTRRRLLSADPDLVVDHGVLYLVRLFLWFGRYEEAWALVEAAAGSPWVEPAIEGDLRMTAQITQLARSHTTHTHAAPAHDPAKDASPGPGDGGLVVSIPVWGAEHVDLWIRTGLASMLAPGNLALFASPGVRLHIYTRPADQARLMADPGFRRLAALAEPIFLDLTDFLDIDVDARAYRALTVAHWTTMVLARAEGADALLLVADYVFADGALATIAERRERRSVDACFSVDLPMSDRVIATLDARRDADGVLAFPPGDLLALFADAISKRVETHAIDVDAGLMPTDPSRLNILHADGTIEIRSMQPQLFYIATEGLARFWPSRFSMTDNGPSDWLLDARGDESRLEMLVDPSVFIVATVELGEEERVKAGTFPGRTAVADPLGALPELISRAGFRTGARKWALGQRLLVRRPGDEAVSGPLANGPLDPGPLDRLRDTLEIARPDGDQAFFAAIVTPHMARV